MFPVWHFLQVDCSCAPQCRSTAPSGLLSSSTTPTRMWQKNPSTSIIMLTTWSPLIVSLSHMPVSNWSFKYYFCCLDSGWKSDAIIERKTDTDTNNTFKGSGLVLSRSVLGIYNPGWWKLAKHLVFILSKSTRAPAPDFLQLRKHEN